MRMRCTLLVAAVLGMASDCHGAAAPEARLNRLIGTYSTQQIIGLDVQETFTLRLGSGAERVLRLVSVQEQRDSVIGLVRSADVRVEIDGRPLRLTCGPYVMPTETAGLRVQADTTSAWGNTPKRVQFSLWDAADPIVDTQRFGFPLPHLRLFSQGTQAYNEPVHLGAGDGDPQGQCFHHDYGFDNAGFEGREEVVSATEGMVVRFWPSREQLSSILVRDSGGLVWEYGHLSSAAPDIVLNARVARGRKLGLLGRTGPSGNFSHLHLGAYLSEQDVDGAGPCRRLNLYPWLVTAYQARHPRGLLAVARPHHTALTGETVVFDGSNSLAWGGTRIVEWRWVLPDGRTILAAEARQTFERPGAYVAALWVKDDRGAEDVDFCPVKVFSRADPEKALGHIFMTYTPTQDLRPDQPVTLRFWFQGSGGGPLQVDFGDGTPPEELESYAERQHRFRTSGIYVVTAQCQAEGKPIMQKLKIVVTAAPGTESTVVGN
jgi:hypothetical protein